VVPAVSALAVEALVLAQARLAALLASEALVPVLLVLHP